MGVNTLHVQYISAAEDKAPRAPDFSSFLGHPELQNKKVFLIDLNTECLN